MADNNLYIGRTNYLNDLFSGIFQGAGQIVDKIQLNNQMSDLQNDYKQTKDYLAKSFQDVQKQQQEITNLVPNPNQQRASIPPVENPNLDKTNIYNQLLDKSMGMYSEYGDASKPYVSALEGLYKNYFEQPEPKFNDVNVGNDRYRIDSKGNYTKVLSGEEKEKPKVLTAGDFSKMTLDDIEKLTDSELDKGFDYLSVETRDKLFEKYPELKRKYEDKYNIGEFEKKKTGVSGRRRYDSKKTKDEADILSAVANNNLNYENLTPEEKTAFDADKQKLADQEGMTVDELNQYAENYRITGDKDVSDDEVTTANLNTYRQDIQNFQDYIENDLYSYLDDKGNKVGNYKISSDDWFRELHEAGFFDDISTQHYNLIADWFKSKTGVSLRKYMQ